MDRDRERTPPPDIDHRPLYERLAEQRQKTEMERTESMKLGNRILGLDEEDAQFLDQLAINKKKREAEWRAEEQLITKRFREQADKLSSSTGASSGLKKVPVPNMMHAKSTSQAKSTSSTLSNASIPRNSHRKIVAGALKKPKTNEPANDGKLEGKASVKEMKQSRDSQNDTVKDHSGECGTNVKEVPALKSILSAYGTSSSDEED